MKAEQLYVDFVGHLASPFDQERLKRADEMQQFDRTAKDRAAMTLY